MELISQIFEVCIIPLLGVLTAYFIKFVNVKSMEINNNTKNEIYQLAGFGIYDLMFLSKGITLTITDETKLECVIKIDLGNSGSVTITSKDVGNTIIQGL